MLNAIIFSSHLQQLLLVSQECQVQEGDCGDFWQVGSTAIDIPARTNNKGQYVYDPAGSLVHFGKNVPAGPRCWKSPDNEKALLLNNCFHLFLTWS